MRSNRFPVNIILGVVVTLAGCGIDGAGLGDSGLGGSNGDAAEENDQPDAEAVEAEAAENEDSGILRPDVGDSLMSQADSGLPPPDAAPSAGEDAASPMLELMRNGDFREGGEEWNLRLNEGAKATLTFAPASEASMGKSARVRIGSTSDAAWHIQLHQGKLEIKANRRYRVQFVARASRPVALPVHLEATNGADGDYWHEAVLLQTSATRFGPYDFESPVSDAAANFRFKMGLIPLDTIVVIESASLVELTGAPPEAP